MGVSFNITIRQTADPDGNERLQWVVRLVLAPHSDELGEEPSPEEPHDLVVPNVVEVPESQVVP